MESLRAPRYVVLVVFFLCVSIGLLRSLVPAKESSQKAVDATCRAPTVRPPPLSPGDTIALVAPAGRVTARRVKEARANLTRLGYKVKILRRHSKQAGFLSGSDTQRALEIDRAFSDPDVKMVLCIRGGYGSPRILNLLNYESIRRHPKILIGYSDVSALLNAIHQRTGLVTFHGPMAQKDFSGKHGLSPFASKYLWSLLSASTDANQESIQKAKFEDWGAQAPAKLGKRRTVVPGVAEGRLVGGNLSTIVALLGTPFEIETDGAILFLEDVNEEPFRIDRMLCQLRLAGKLQEVDGVLLGGFTACVPKTKGDTTTANQVLEHYLDELGVPVLAGFPAGHLVEQVTLPIGCRVRLDATKKVLSIIETAVAR